MKKILLVSLVVLISQFIIAQRTLLINGTLHVGNGDIINNAAIGIDQNKIVLVKNALAYSYKKTDWDTIIDLQQQFVYPGFVAPNTTLGITEIDAVRATNDFEEVGEYNPHVRSLIAYNVESKVIGTVMTNGVLLTQTTPRGGIISGSSSVMKMHGWNWEDAVVKADDGIHVNWPSAISKPRWWSSNKEYKANETYSKIINELDDFFQASKNYIDRQDKNVIDLRFDAMSAIFNGEKRVYFHADDVQQLLDVIEFAKKHNIKFPVIIGGYEAYLIPERVRDSKIPIMLPRIHSLPRGENEAIDLPYKLPFILYQNKIKFCLQNEGDMEAMNARNIPFLAGTANAYGLPLEEAVKSISLNACQIMGIDKDFGSVEVGKNATLFVSKGNALDMLTNDVQLIIMNGEFVPVTNSQLELYNKYKKKLKL